MRHIPKTLKGTSVIQGKHTLSPIFRDIFVNENPLLTYGGYYDINVAGGALKANEEDATLHNDDIAKLVNLAVGSSGDDITFQKQNLPNNPGTGVRTLKLRKNVLYSTGNFIERTPIMFYAEGANDEIFVIDENTQQFVEGPDYNTAEAINAVGSFNIAPGDVDLLTEMTVFVCGARMLHELGDFWGYLNSFLIENNSEILANVLTVPVPEEPGVLAIRVSMTEPTPGDFLPTLQMWVNGEEVDVSAQVPTEPSEEPGITIDSFLQMMTYPCWGTQKLLVISRALTNDEIDKITRRMFRTIRVRTNE